jgi:integrase
MPRRSDLPRGITRVHPQTKAKPQKGDRWVYRATVRVGKWPAWCRTYPSDTPLAVMNRDRRAARAHLEAQDSLGGKASRDSLAAAVDRYLTLKKNMPSIRDRERELGSWLPCFGKRALSSIQPTEIHAQITEWASLSLDEHGRRYSATTLNHRRTALSNLYRVINGKGGYNPVRDVDRLREPDAIDRALPLPMVREILARIDANGKHFGAKRQSLSAIRAACLAFTGMRVGELMAVKAVDVRFDVEEPFVSVRTAKGGKNRRVPLGKEAAAAFRELRRMDGFGPFSKSSLGKSVRAACARLTQASGEPYPIIRVHDLRHSFARWLVNDGGAQLHTAKYILGHSSIKTTERYVCVSEADARRAIRKLDAA